MRLTSEAETWRRTTRMTGRALEGLAELPRDERDAAVEVLREPFFHLRPHKMAQRKDLDLWRVRVNRDVRITYVVQAGCPLILHVGRHAASDSFVARCGEPEDAGVPLEESELMKTATRPARPSVNGAAQAAAPAALADDLLRVMSVLVSHAVSRDERADNELALEGVLALTVAVDEMREQLTQLALEREDDRGAVEKVQALVKERSPMERNGQESDAVRRLMEDQHELRRGLTSCRGQVDEQARRSAHGRSDVQAQINELSARVTALSADVAWLVAKERQREQGWLKRLWRR